MRRFVFVLLISVLEACKLKGSLTSLVAFEGEIDMTTTSSLGAGGAPIVMSQSFAMKGTKLRTESKTVASYALIVDTETKKLWMVDDAARTYMDVDVAKMTAPSASTTKPAATAKRLGKTDRVAGYACDEWEITAAGARTEYCIATGLSLSALGASGPFAMFSRDGDAANEVLSHGFPLRMIMSDASGKPMMKMEATRIEKKSLPDAEFQIPPGYTKTPSPI